MHTACLLTVSQHALLGGVPAGGVPAQGVYLSRVAGTYLGGCTCGGWWCTCQGRGIYPGGVPARGGGCTCPGWVPTQVLLPVNRMTDRCKNITLPQTSVLHAVNYDFGGNMFTFLVCECAAFFQCGTARIRSVYCGTEKVCEYRSS